MKGAYKRISPVFGEQSDFFEYYTDIIATRFNGNSKTFGRHQLYKLDNKNFICLYQCSPVIDEASGSVIATRDTRKLSFLDPTDANRYKYLQLEFSSISAEADIEYFVFNSKNRTYAAIFRNYDSIAQKKIILSTKEDERIVHSCANEFDGLFGRRVIFETPIGQYFSTLYGDNHEVARKLLVFYHGGPLRSASYPDNKQIINEFVKKGYDVLIPDYSGSFTENSNFRLSLRDLRSMDELYDSLALLFFLEHHREGYERITLAANSFGGMFAKNIALDNRFEGYIDNMLLFAPWDLSTRPSEGEIGAKRMLELNFVFGENRVNRRQVSEKLNWSNRKCDLSIPTEVFFGSSDIISNSSFLGACDKSVNVIELLNTPHEFTMMKALNQIDEFDQFQLDD